MSLQSPVLLFDTEIQAVIPDNIFNYQSTMSHIRWAAIDGNVVTFHAAFQIRLQGDGDNWNKFSKMNGGDDTPEKMAPEEMLTHFENIIFDGGANQDAFAAEIKSTLD